MLDEHKQHVLEAKIQHLEEQLLKNEEEKFDLKKQNFSLLTDLEHAIALLRNQKSRSIAKHCFNIPPQDPIH